MIPSVNDILTNELETETLPSKDYKLSIEQNNINGFCDELEVMEQVIYKILNTEKYQYPIYSFDYGIELIDLYGEPVPYVCSELKRRITEALIQDDRIESVDNFTFELNEPRTIYAKFLVHTIFGNIEEEKVVSF